MNHLHFFRFVLLFGGLCLTSDITSAQTPCNNTSSIIINTGYDHTAGAAIPLNSVDPLWRVTQLSPACISLCAGYSATGSNDAVALPPLVAGIFTWATNPSSKWLCFNSTTGHPGYATVPNVDYTMTLTRPFKTCTEDDFMIEMDLATDNYAYINIDGYITLLNDATTNVASNFNSFRHISQTVHLPAGTHYLNARVANYEPANHPDDYHGLNVVGTITSATGNTSLVTPVSDPNCCCSGGGGPQMSCSGNSVKLNAVYVGHDAGYNCIFDCNANAMFTPGWTPVHYDWSATSSYPTGSPLLPFYSSHVTAAPSDMQTVTTPNGSGGVTLKVAVTLQDLSGVTCTVTDSLHLDCNGGTGFVRMKGVAPGTGVSGSTAATSTIKVFPNPASDAVTITAEQEDIRKVEVYDLNQRLLLTRAVAPTGKTEISLDGLAAGLYIIRVNGKESKLVNKMTHQ